MKVETFADLDALSRAAADDLVRRAREHAGAFHVALSGGSTPKKLFEVLAARGRAALPWERVHLWWGDERCVPPDHPDSNFGMTKRALIDPLGLPAANVHRIAGEREPGEAAAAYETELVAALGTPPVFDLVYLGMGSDGHTASLFPGSAGLRETQRFCIANHVDSPLAHGKATRITVTYPVLAAARATRFLVGGADKADALAKVAAGADLPSAHVRGNDVAWLVDHAAAAKLEVRS